MSSRLRFPFLFILLIGVWLVAAVPWVRAAQGVTLEVSDEVRGALAASVHELEQALGSGDPLERLAAARRARRAMEDALSAEGWFSPQIDITLTDPPTVVVQLGARTGIAEVLIEFQGAISRSQGAARREQLINSWKLPKGAPFRQADWDAAKTQLLTQLSAEDYAAATIVSSRVEVDPARATARIHVVADSGPAFTLGAVQVSGLSRYTPELVARYNAISPGARYSQARLLDLQTALQNTRYFSSVMVDVSRDPDSPIEVPILVQVSEAKSKRLSVGVGGSTNFGPRGELLYEDSNWLDRAWGLGLGARGDRLRQSQYVEAFLPMRPGGARDSLGVLHENTDIQGLATRRVALGANREWKRDKLETRVSINAQREESLAEGLDAVARRALSVAGVWAWRDVDNPLDPRRGAVFGVEVAGATRLLLSDENCARGYVRAQQYWPVGALDVFSLRGELGVTAARDRDGVPQGFLFRAGGAQSVRGYAYQGLGVRQGNATVGGRLMAVASAEYTHWLNPRWGMAGFMDAGNVSDDRASFRFVFGAGLGARWRSAAGPLAFDLAYGERDRKVRPHFSIMIAF